jgi:hypothetical protein
MKNSLIWLGLLAAFAVTTAWGGGVGNDTPPSWRGNAYTTYNVWNFVTGATTIQPDVLNDPYGTPSAAINPGVDASGWYGPGSPNGNPPAFYGGSVQEMWDISTGNITLTVPEVGSGLYEDIQVQVTYWSDISQAPSVSIADGTQQGSTTTTVAQNPSGPGEWLTDLSTWLVEPVNNQDIITILGDQTDGSVIDQVIVDTVTVPEPSTMSLAALGAVALVVAAVRRRELSR